MISQSTLPPGYAATPDMLAGRVILVTGAGQGLGRAAALAFAQHGASVILHGRDLAKLEPLYDELEAADAAKAAILPLNYLQTSQDELDGFAHTIHANFGRLDGIFHSANHFSPLTPLALQNLDAWQQHWQVNVAAPAALTKACLPMLLRAEDASVVFLTETHAVQPKPFWGAFALAKGALSELAQMWRDELPADTHVHFHACLPGPVASPMRSKSHPAEGATTLIKPDSLTPHFLYLIGPDGKAANGRLHVCQG